MAMAVAIVVATIAPIAIPAFSNAPVATAVAPVPVPSIGIISVVAYSARNIACMLADAILPATNEIMEQAQLSMTN